MKRFFVRFVSSLFDLISLPEKVRDLFMWPIATRILGESYVEPITLKAGFRLNAYLGDQLGRLALFYGEKREYFWEPTTTKLLEKLVPHAKHVIIAGSHIGLTVLYARKAMGHEGSVHAFEPIPHLYERSNNNFESNNALGDIRLTHSALGNMPGSVRMTEDRIRSRIIGNAPVGKGLATTEVEITTIDTYRALSELESIELIFLDVEGYELNALKGAGTLLGEMPPRDIIYEISLPYKDDLRAARDLEAYLKPFGYSFFIIDESYDPTHTKNTNYSINLIPTSETVYEKHRTIRYFNVLATLRTQESLRNLGSVTIL